VSTETETPTPIPPRAHAAQASLARTIFLTSGNVVLVMGILYATRFAPEHMQWWLQAAAGAVPVLFTGTYVSLHLWRHWVSPARELQRLIPQIRKGYAPIDDLTGVRGGLDDVALELRFVFQDLRRQRAEMSKLEMEMSQRVANRTNALERSLGALQQQASKDALTGLHNRRMLDACLEELVEKARIAAESVTVLMIDVDDFKLLNDTLGHGAGDEFLRSLGQLIRSTLRETDYAFRYGGDEFLLILPQTTKDHAEPLAERLMSLVDAMTRTYKVPRPPRLSIGMLDVASLDLDVTTAAIIAEADRLLYTIKQARKAKRGTNPPPVARVA